MAKQEKKKGAPEDSKTHKTAHHKKAVLDALEKSLGVVTDACKVVGIGRRTFYDWTESDPEFAAAVKDIENVAIDFAESQLFKQIKDGEVSSTIFYLKTKGKNRGYIEKRQEEISGPEGKPLQTENVHRVVFEDYKNDPAAL